MRGLEARLRGGLEFSSLANGFFHGLLGDIANILRGNGGDNVLKGMVGMDDLFGGKGTDKLYIGGKQARPDAGYSYSVYGAKGKAIGQAGLGNRKDIRNAVEAAAKASSWGAATAHNRAQVLYYIAENLSARAEEFTARLRQVHYVGEDDTAFHVIGGNQEDRVSIKRLGRDRLLQARRKLPRRPPALLGRDARLFGRSITRRP